MLSGARSTCELASSRFVGRGRTTSVINRKLYSLRLLIWGVWHKKFLKYHLVDVLYIFHLYTSEKNKNSLCECRRNPNSRWSSDNSPLKFWSDLIGSCCPCHGAFTCNCVIFAPFWNERMIKFQKQSWATFVYIYIRLVLSLFCLRVLKSVYMLNLKKLKLKI